MATQKKKEDELLVESRYVPLDTSGHDYASMAGMSDLDRAALDAAQKSWQDASAAGNQAGMDAAHQQAEAIRNKYNYSGGSDGSQYLPTSQTSFNYATAPSYVSKYQSQIDELTQQIMGRPSFSYNYETDPLYAQYRDSYTRNGQRAMQDTLGQVSARTGGMASSYATTASQQAYNEYMSALADKIPELQQLAYAMYQDEGDNLYNQMNMLLALEQGDYAKYANLLAQYNADRNFNYGVYNDDRNLNYQLGRDEIADNRYDQEWNYQTALDRAELLASAGDFSGYKALGYTDEQIGRLQAAYNSAMYAGSSGGSGGGSGGGSTEESILDIILGMDSEARAYEFLVGQDLSEGEINNFLEYYRQEKENESSKELPKYAQNVDATDTEYQVYLQNVRMLDERGGSASDYIDNLLKGGEISERQAISLFAAIGVTL